MITCESHGRTDGYIACRHVMSGARCTHYVAPATRGLEPYENLGEALCAPCARVIEQLEADDLMLVCASCLEKIIGVLEPRQ